MKGEKMGENKRTESGTPWLKYKYITGFFKSNKAGYSNYICWKE